MGASDREPREDFSLDDEGGAWEAVSRWPGRGKQERRDVRDEPKGKSLWAHLKEKRQ